MQGFTCICCHCNGNVDCVNLHYLLFPLIPSGIGQRHVLQRQRSSLDHKVIDTGLHSESVVSPGLTARKPCCCSPHEHILQCSVQRKTCGTWHASACTHGLQKELAAAQDTAGRGSSTFWPCSLRLFRSEDTTPRSASALR